MHTLTETGGATSPIAQKIHFSRIGDKLTTRFNKMGFFLGFLFWHLSTSGLDDAGRVVVLEAGTEVLIGLEVEVHKLAAELGSAVEVVDVAVVGGVVKHRGGLGARAHRQLAFVTISVERNVELINVVGGLASGTCPVHLVLARARHGVRPIVVRVRPPVHPGHPCQDLFLSVCTAPVHLCLQLTHSVHSQGRSGAVVVSRRHHGDRGHQGKGGGVHFVGSE